MQFTAIPGPMNISKRGVSVKLDVGDDVSADDYRLYVDIPCIVTIEPMPAPVDGDVEMLEVE